jgi:hypothetical protein
MIEQMEKDVFYSTLYHLLLVYVSGNSRNSAVVSYITNSDVITGVTRDKDRGVATAGQLYKQIVLIAALECAAAVLCLLHDSKFDIHRSRV